MRILLLLFYLQTIIFAQTDYYSGIDNQTGTKLKSDLHKIIRAHKRFPYTSSSTDTWDILKAADRDPNNPSNVILIYTGYTINGPAEYNNGSGWNREHVWAKSHGFPSESDTAYTDCHHLHASDIAANSARGNKDFDYGGTEYLNTGNYTDGDSWEPRDDVKGDVARTMLYMTVRYESSSTYDLELVDYTGTSGTVIGKKSTLMEWNRLDPPDDFERNRNTAVESFQQNRNPFIDHPEFADRIYNEDQLYINSIESIATTHFVITFSKDLDSATASDPENYEFFGTNTPIYKAEYNYDNSPNKVLIITTIEISDSAAIIRASNIKDINGNTIIENSLGSTIVSEKVIGIKNDEYTPIKFALSQNYPNPFNPSTVIQYSLPIRHAGIPRHGGNAVEAEHVTLKVYDILGNEVATLVNKYQPAGNYEIEFNTANRAGKQSLSSGVYIYTLNVGGLMKSKKMVLLR